MAAAEIRKSPVSLSTASSPAVAGLRRRLRLTGSVKSRPPKRHILRRLILSTVWEWE
ncbi:uncharacterized protein G2W53_023084 [Senna tora]|uniref:Uncharacterized protein n=1 Tax=Senna tora TaxID=362788 RepID=A0A834TN77_9FABA|nr:uncharacterized protein G2W53_023084 [Senna tora]